jgi:hypothetical protein
MSPIEQHLVNRVSGALAGYGIVPSAVVVLSADADGWSYRIEASNRTFELGFNRGAPAWARETTAGAAKPLTSNDHAPVNTTGPALDAMIRLVARAIDDPAFPPRDPPVI